MGKPKVRGGRSGNGDRPGSREFWIYRASRRAAHGAAALVVAAGATVGVAALEQDDDAALVLDAPAEGALGRDGVGVWTFDGTAGTTVSVHVDASDFDAVAHLWSPTGELVGTADEGGAMMGMAPDGPLVTDLPLPGRYRIEVRSVDDDGRGDYAVAVRTVRKLPPNVPVTGGTGDIDGWTLPVEVWTFDGTAGHRVHVNAITPIISLRSPLGEQVVVDRDHDLFGMDWWTAVLPSTGEYQIRVHPFGSPSYEIMMRTSGGDSGVVQVEDDDAGLPYAPELGRAWSATHGDENGWTDLHYAAALNRPDMARRLLDAGASMEARLVNDDDWFSGRLRETFEAFNFPIDSVFSIAMGDYGHRHRRGWDATPLDLAIANGASDVVELLLNRGANLAERWPGYVIPPTPLHCAVYIGSVEVVELLLDWGANIEAWGSWWTGVRWLEEGTPLWVAGVKMTELLLNRGANIIDEDGDTLLHYEARTGVYEKVKLLLDWGISVGELNGVGDTPLHSAMRSADRVVITSDDVIGDKVERVELLLDRGANIEAVNSDGDTPLHYAARRATVTLAELLLNRGANIEVVNSFGQTPLHIAVHSIPFFLELVELLLNRGANIEAVDDNGETPLHYAAHGGPRGARLELVELLLNRGANVEAANNDGETPLDVATNSKVVDLLSNR